MNIYIWLINVCATNKVTSLFDGSCIIYKLGSGKSVQEIK